MKRFFSVLSAITILLTTFCYTPITASAVGELGGFSNGSNLRFGVNQYVSALNTQTVFADEALSVLRTNKTALKDINSLISANAGYTISGSASKEGFFGTGSKVSVLDGNNSLQKVYSLVVNGDVNGDSVCDVLDCMTNELVLSGDTTLSNEYLVAGDFNQNGAIDDVDFQSVVNNAIINTMITETVDEGEYFEVLTYPNEAVKTFEESNITEAELTHRADSDFSSELYVSTQGYQDVNGVLVSPCYTAKIDGNDIPVYATTVFLGSTGKGTLQNYSEIYIDPTITGFSFTLELNSKSLNIKNAICLPELYNLTPNCFDGKMTININNFGIYTFVFNNESQECAYTLFVREKIDEDAEIERLKGQYGEENVTVFEKGLHKIDYIHRNTPNSIIYLKQGAYLLANHKYDITSDSVSSSTAEPNANSSNGIGLNRFPFINFHNTNTVKLLGRGIIDLSHLDRAERRGVVFTFCNDIEVRGPKIINPPEWAFITYRCSNVSINQLDFFGYRQNSDAYAIANTKNATIWNSFARSGDDLFDVKTLGGDETATSENITFSECIAWAGKARCFGICGEVEKSIKNITYKNSAVIYHDATWDENRIAPLSVVIEVGGGSITDVTFDNIEIHQTKARPISVDIYNDSIDNFTINNLTFKNIRYSAGEKARIANNSNKNNSITVNLEEIDVRNLGFLQTVKGQFTTEGKNVTLNWK